MIEIPEDELRCGDHITAVIDKALALAIEKNEHVRFVFNGTEVVVTKYHNREALYARWMEDMDALALKARIKRWMAQDYHGKVGFENRIDDATFLADEYCKLRNYS